MRCAICGNEVVSTYKAAIPTTTGEVVHIACADREAWNMWRRRSRWALAHALILIGVLGALAWVMGLSWQLGGLGLLCGSLHYMAHRRWWYYAHKDLRTVIKRVLARRS